jgi:hypothetical protein
MTTQRDGRRAADRVYRGEGPARAPKWERERVATSWCALCHDYTEHDPQGCVECYDPEKDEPAAEAVS